MHALFIFKKKIFIYLNEHDSGTLLFHTNLQIFKAGIYHRWRGGKKR